VTVQNRLPGYPMATLDGRLLGEVLQLVERQADAAIPAGDRDFTSYIADVLFDDWDEVWADAARAGAAAGPLCARIRRWLQPAWGLRLPPADYAHPTPAQPVPYSPKAGVQGPAETVTPGP